jgi:hypothetical protein
MNNIIDLNCGLSTCYDVHISPIGQDLSRSRFARRIVVGLLSQLIVLELESFHDLIFVVLFET